MINNSRDINIRKTAEKRRKRRKRSYTLYYILLFLLILITGVTLSLTVFFKIEQIKVVGNKTILSDQIIKATNIKVGDNLLRANTKDASTSIINSIINVEKVSIKRSLPATIVINIVEAKGYYTTVQNKKFLIISKGGRVIETNLAAKPNNLILINGISQKKFSKGDFLSKKIKNKFELLDLVDFELNKYKFANITGINLTDSIDLSFTYNDKITVRLGTATDLDAKIKFVKEIISSRLTPADAGVIDATNPFKKVFFEPTPSS